MLTTNLYKKTVMATALIGTMALSACGSEAVEEITSLDNDQQKMSYSIGLSIGENLKAQNIEVDTNIMTKGISDSLAGGERLLTDEQMAEVMQNYQKQQTAKVQAEKELVGVENKAASEVFLAENKAKDGVVTTDSGLQYKVVTAGEGDIPTAEDTVEVHYIGTLPDGTEFDSSHKRGQTISFPVKGVIPGWTEALQLMKTGSKWELYIPSDLAYGPGGTGGIIGPNQALVFEVELVSIPKAE